ncbi:hypothetical protein [Nocardioides sp. 503]|uniref:hypothetical protein n=1 Tax=Nocardioides sp. 503 TaxID=2508326 RepID=UPI0010705A74|nr:hypothetical protein [Nocardioides sp. 503]
MAIKVKRRRSPDAPKTRWWVALLMVVGLLAGLVGLAVAGRWWAMTVAPWLYLAADADHARLVAILVTLWAVFPLGCLGVARVFKRHGRVGGWAAVVALSPVALFLWGTMPGRNNGGRLARSLNEAVGGGLADTGEVFTSMALAGLLGNFAIVLLAMSILGSRPSWWRRSVAAAVLVVAWSGIGLLVLQIVGDTEPRGAWLDRTAAQVDGGDEGLTGDFPIGIDASVLEVVDCDTAASALRVAGDVPELAGCRQALLVSATGRYDEGGQRRSSGELVAVVLQTRTEGQLEDLDEALDGVELVEGAGLPQAPGATLATEATRALSLVVAAEDTGDIPLPSEGAGLRPLTRALAYVVIGTATGFYLAPPDEPPASPSPSS